MRVNLSGEWGLLVLAIVFLAGCTAPSVKGVRVVDDSGAPLVGATVRLTYSGPHTVVINESGPSDAGGYVAVGRYKLQKESVATVMTATEIVSFNSSQFGELRDGVITLSTWRGFKDRTLETGTDGGFFTPSIYLQKDPSQ